MKFFLSERNLGPDATKKLTLTVIEMLVQKGWDVEYGEKANQVTDPSEQGQEQKLMDAFTNDFLQCLEQVES
jgi:hypothetical protein